LKPYAAVIDGRCLFDRAWHASRNAPELLDGQESHLVAAGAALASLAPLLGPRGRLPVEPSHLLICWDGLKAKTNKPRLPRADEHLPDLNYFKNILPSIVGGDYYEPADGTFGESDDAVATAVDQYSPDFDFCVISTDKDLQQLARDATYYNLAEQRVITEDLIKERWGACRPSHVALYLALVGDSIDGIDGVDGVGKKGAIKILSEIGDLPLAEAVEKILEQLNKEKAGQFLAALEMTVLVRDMPDVPPPGEISICGFDVFDELGITSGRSVWGGLLGRLALGTANFGPPGEEIEC
jgi:hypothetical protein